MGAMGEGDLTGVDVSRELVLDGNAAAGLLQAVFGGEMTAEPAECVHCGNEAPVGALVVFGRAPGVVLRCPACGGVVLRVVETDTAYLVDAQGLTYLRIAKARQAPPDSRGA